MIDPILYKNVNIIVSSNDKKQVQIQRYFPGCLPDRMSLGSNELKDISPNSMEKLQEKWIVLHDSERYGKTWALQNLTETELEDLLMELFISNKNKNPVLFQEDDDDAIM